MTLISKDEIESASGEALKKLREGDLFSAIQTQTILVEQLMGLGVKAIKTQGLEDTLENSASRLVDMLRWGGMYVPAIELQERLIAYLPAIAEALHLGAANLRVESRIYEAEGLQQLRDLVAEKPDDYWYHISLACGLMYMDQFDEAERLLRVAVAMTHVRKVDRAIAQVYLFGLVEQFGRTDEALLAWREASRLDPALRAEMLPAVCRMLINWRKFPEARKHIAMEKDALRRQFFLGLLAFVDGNYEEARSTWRSLMNTYDPVTLSAAHDEFAETCLRMANTAGVVMSLEKLVESGQSSFYRNVILGLAYAQRGMLNRTNFYLDVAMRLGDMERPRLTAPGGTRRVLGMLAGVLYSGTPLDPDVRKEIETYFVPQG
jgi:tetratricopeptide (TPR) repeat protein